MLSCTGGQTHRYGDPGVSARFAFTGDPTQGDASIAVSDLRAADTATYQCKVKKAPGVDMRKVTLVVLGEGHFLFLNWFFLFHCRLPGSQAAAAAAAATTPSLMATPFIGFFDAV